MGIASLNRLRVILTTFLLFGGNCLLRRARLLYFVPWRLRLRALFHRGEAQKESPCPEREERIISPAGLRELFEKLGPTFVKLGQILSLRPDFVGEELSRELSKLQSDVSPFPFEEVEKIIKAELGGRPDRIFRSFDPQPAAAASLAQVHHAFLEDGTEVAVKVQRPEIRELIEKDIRLLAWLTRLAEALVPRVRPYNPVQVVAEFADWSRRELNFAVEGHNAERFRFAFRENPHIKIPLIYWEFTSPRVLTMEYIHGVRADDFAGIEREGLDRKQLALNGVDAQLQQILIDGFFHADPHPGNSFALKRNKLCFYDFGIVGHLSEAQRRELTSCLVAFSSQDIESFLAHFLHLTHLSDASDVPAFRKDASEILSELFFSPTNPSVAWIFFRLINKGATRRIGFPADLALVSKSLITTEAMGLALYPDFDFNEHLAPFVKKAFESAVDPTRLRRSFANDLLDYASFLKELPERIHTLLTRLDVQEGAGLGVDRRDLILLQNRLDRAIDSRLAEIALLSAAFLVVAALVGVGESVLASRLLPIGVGFFLAIFLLFARRARKKR